MFNKASIAKKITLLFFCCAVLEANAFQVLDVESLVDELKGGGHVIYMRHAKTHHDQSDTARENLSDCRTQRNLSELGRDQARLIAKKIAQLSIPIHQVYSSPYCRCKETAELSFGSFIIENDLQFSISKNEHEAKKLGSLLEQMMLAANTEKSNVVFVGHTANLKDGLGVWPKPEGVWVVFKKEQEAMVYRGMITPEDWPKLQGDIDEIR